MSIKPVLKLMMNHQLLALTGSNALLKPFYQLNYLVAAKECSVFELLLDAPKSFDQIAEVYCADNKAREALEGWLGLGVRLGYLRLDSSGYSLKGLAKKLAMPQNDAALALLQEAAGLNQVLDASPGPEPAGSSNRGHKPALGICEKTLSLEKRQ